MNQQQKMDREKILAGLKEISSASAVNALNNLLVEPHELSQTTRKYCLKFFIQEGITSVYVSNKQVKKFALSDRVFNSFSKVKTRKKNSFYYDGKNLLVVVNEKVRPQVERVLSQIGLEVIHYFGKKKILKNKN